jgi:hypothetical protein
MICPHAEGVKQKRVSYRRRVVEQAMGGQLLNY